MFALPTVSTRTLAVPELPRTENARIESIPLPVDGPRTDRSSSGPLETVAEEMARARESRRVRSVPMGTRFRAGTCTFAHDRSLYLTTMSDYAVISTAPLDDAIDRVPTSLREKLQGKWRYYMHVSDGPVLELTPAALMNRAVGGLLIAFKYMLCSVNNRQAMYFGYLETCRESFDGRATHTVSCFSMEAVFPREMFVYLRLVTACNAHKNEGCKIWQCLLDDGRTKRSYCTREVPWDRLYVILGDVIVDPAEFADGGRSSARRRKEPRNCPVCANCFKCSLRVENCYTHRICRHVDSTKIDPNNLDESWRKTKRNSRIRRCKAVRN